MKGKFNCLSILERDSDKLVFIAGADSQIYGFGQSDHDIID